MKTEINKDYFAHARVGLFTHYTYATYAGKGDNWGGTVYSQNDHRLAVSVEEAAALFDGEKYAKVAHDLGADLEFATGVEAGRDDLRNAAMLGELIDWIRAEGYEIRPLCD